MAIESMYNKYYNYINNIISYDNLPNFKSDTSYQAILEHVSYDLGKEYLKLIKDIRNMKDEVYASYQSQGKPEIWDTNGEGYVRYAQPGNKYGNIKIVPTTWVPGR